MSAAVMAVVGTRPDAIKLAPVVLELKRRVCPRVELCATAQHRQMADQVLRSFDLTPDHDLDAMREDQSLSELTALLLPKLTELFQLSRPSVVLVVGDTTTGFVASLAAFYQRIAVGHIEAGLRTGKRYSPFPEEMLRRMMTQLATYQFAPTRGAVETLLGESLPGETEIYETGNPVVDAVRWITSRAAPQRSRAGRMILVTAHRRESFGEPLRRICAALKEIVRRHPDIELVYPVHRNPNVSGPVGELLGGTERITLVPPQDYPSFVRLMAESYLVISDSGGVQEEAPVLGKPVLVMREDTERPEAVDAGSAILVGTSVERIVAAADRLLEDEAAYAAASHVQSPFGDGHAAERIADILTQRLCGLGDGADRMLIRR
jgi:UDP-N-acetylglucosamine 2-epimerase (non-hydrolysing)